MHLVAFAFALSDYLAVWLTRSVLLAEKSTREKDRVTLAAAYSPIQSPEQYHPRW